MLRLIFLALLAANTPAVWASPGTDVPWVTYEAEEMATTGTVSGSGYDPYQVETESSGCRCVKLTAAGQFVEFTAKAAANAIVVRYSLPDSPDGAGFDSTLGLYVNGKLVQPLPVTSKYSWLYGAYPFTNHPQDGRPRNRYDEVRAAGLRIGRGDVVRVQTSGGEAAADCTIDLIDLENASAPLSAPPDALSVTDYGATGDGEADDTAALRNCLAAAEKQGKIVWVPAGTYKVTGDLDVAAGVTIQGAGMWHTTFVGDAGLYAHTDRRVRFVGHGDRIHLADFAIVGKLDYRDDREANDGIVGTFGEGSPPPRLWVEHTKTGLWIVNSSQLVVDGCRFRNTVADGANFCVGVRGSILQNCTVRGTGDDCFAFWPATYLPQKFAPGGNVLRHCTGQLPFLANGAAIYGGEGNAIEDCLFSDVPAGCGILLSTTFPTAETGQNIDNNFTGTTVVRNCDLVRCGGFDPARAWCAALQVCLDRRSISGLRLCHLNIEHGGSNGFGIVAPNAGRGGAVTLSDTQVEDVTISEDDLGASGHHGLWIDRDVHGGVVIRGSTMGEPTNRSSSFTIK